MKSSRIAAIVLAAAAFAATARPAAAQWPGWKNPDHAHSHLRPGGRILPDGPGFGWGFANGAPDSYGWFDHGDMLPLGGNRIPEYYFPRYYSVPPTQAFLPSYYNPVLTRGQRYVSYSGCGGDHPAGRFPLGSAMTPEHPYQETIGTGPRVQIPNFTGRSEAPPIQPGGSGLTP
jgi:hypothetical protein